MSRLAPRLKLWLTGLAALAALGLAAPAPVYAHTGTPCPAPNVLLLPAWYNNLTIQPNCNQPDLHKLEDIWVIVLNVIEMLMKALGYLSAGFIVWGGFRYMKSQGDPNMVAGAKNTIFNAAIGLVIAIGSVAMVRFVVGLIK
ncbi:MAG: hypothetical protein EOT04_03395 [Candidatus Chaera renei]|uniref:Uncharacterized protein n=1 Tax=Candidatus Chaera renei TaxID=2506947 RepID=A0A4Q0AG91_9BACT|nr:MAG: hypothetical protein EOT04_03395 [Candidatus Chaera renei]